MPSGFFGKLDSNHDGEIDPDELANYEYEIAPDIQVMSSTKRAPGTPAPASRQSRNPDDEMSRDRQNARRDQDYARLGIGGALQGAARYGLLNLPEPVAAADSDFNRGVTLDEFRQAAIARFQLLRHGALGRAHARSTPGDAPGSEERVSAGRAGKMPTTRGSATRCQADRRTKHRQTFIGRRGNYFTMFPRCRSKG